jgi:hypothetical protein
MKKYVDMIELTLSTGNQSLKLQLDILVPGTGTCTTVLRQSEWNDQLALRKVNYLLPAPLHR